MAGPPWCYTCCRSCPDGDLPCGACDTPLTYDAPWRRWWCPSCKYAMVYDREALAALAREHVRDGARDGKARRDSGTRQRSPR